MAINITMMEEHVGVKPKNTYVDSQGKLYYVAMNDETSIVQFVLININEGCTNSFDTREGLLTYLENMKFRKVDLDITVKF